MEIFFLVLFLSFFLFLDGLISFAEDRSSVPASLQKDLMSGLLSKDDSLKNPFKPQLPLPQIRRIEGDTEIPHPVKVGSGPRDPEEGSSEKVILIESPTLKISGLVWDSEQPQAIVNNAIVSMGDQIEGWTVTVINEQGIEISAQGRKHFIANGFNSSSSEKGSAL